MFTNSSAYLPYPLYGGITVTDSWGISPRSAFRLIPRNCLLCCSIFPWSANTKSTVNCLSVYSNSGKKSIVPPHHTGKICSAQYFRHLRGESPAPHDVFFGYTGELFVRLYCLDTAMKFVRSGKYLSTELPAFTGNLFRHSSLKPLSRNVSDHRNSHFQVWNTRKQRFWKVLKSKRN